MVTSIKFNDFIEKFYTIDSKISLELDIVNETVDIYDIHNMLLETLIYGVELYNLNIFDNLYNSITHLQKYFNNINIKINIDNYSLKDLTTNTIYDYRYIRFDKTKQFIINGKHIKINILKDIKSFYRFDDKNNLCIFFSWI